MAGRRRARASGLTRMGCIAALAGTLRAFFADERGAAGVEFLFSSPLLFGIMVFTAEYGQALRFRIALDGAVQDTARFLARAPADAVADGYGNTTIAIYPEFIAEADAMMDARLGRDVATAVAVRTVDTEHFRTPFHLVEVSGWVSIELPMLAFINTFLREGIAERLTLAASQQARWGGDGLPGATPCHLGERIRGVC